MLRIFASTLRRSARTVVNNAHPERFALQSLTYAQSKFWKTEVHQNKPAHQGQEHAQTSQGQVNTTGSQDNRVVIVRGLPQNWAEKDISVYFDQDSSRIQKVNLIKNRVGGNTGKALITFNSADNAEGFISKWDRNTIQAGELNQIINAQYFNLQKKEEPVVEAKSDLKTVFVSNLAFNCTADDLHNFASDFGEIVGVDAPMTANNKTKGFAFITFKEVADAQKFLTLAAEKDLLGRRLRIQLSKPRAESKGARKSTGSNFSFNKTESEETGRENSFSDGKRLYKDLTGKARTGSSIRVGRSIASKDSGSGFDI